MQHANAMKNMRDSSLVRQVSLLLLIPLLSMFASGCASPGQTDFTSSSLHETLSVLAKKHNICGVAVAVIKNRQLDSIDLATGCHRAAALSGDSVFQAASLSKPVFAYAVLKLVAKGKLALDVPVVNYLPQGYRHQPEPWKADASYLVTDARLQAITVRMVLNHTSGLPGWSSAPLKVETTPGTKWNYSGEGYVLLQRAVEAVTHQPLDQFMTAQVFKPLAMNQSSYVWNDRIAPHLQPGRKANGSLRATLELKNPNAAFSLFTTAADYGKFLVAVLGDEELIKQVTASPVAVDASLGLSWGLGWGMEQRHDGPHIWQWGNNIGYRAFAIASVKTGDGFVMLTNSENGLELAEPLAKKILPGEHKLFQSPVLGFDVINWVCNTVRICL